LGGLSGKDRSGNGNRDRAENGGKIGKKASLMAKQEPLQEQGVDVERMYFFFLFDLIPICNTSERGYESARYQN
jgi:hypothetical protein